MKTKQPEVWLRGPLADVPALLQPVAHSLLQAREEVSELMTGFPDDKLWDKAAGLASVGFHLQHLTGVLDRLYTYAEGAMLSQEQLEYLESEGRDHSKSVAELVKAFNKQVDTAIYQLKNADETTLTAEVGVGRALLPSTVIGLYVHSAEHTMRHVGQLLVTTKVLSLSKPRQPS